ncbi:hypothetical protein ANO11243_026420 [Dothideomycetidae sp. 11243]|nr:hypothetical protein ANO11243_026420 [fungal sp. No.11243]
MRPYCLFLPSLAAALFCAWVAPAVRGVGGAVAHDLRLVAVVSRSVRAAFCAFALCWPAGTQPQIIASASLHSHSLCPSGPGSLCPERNPPARPSSSPGTTTTSTAAAASCVVWWWCWMALLLVAAAICAAAAHGAALPSRPTQSYPSWRPSLPPIGRMCASPAARRLWPANVSSYSHRPTTWPPLPNAEEWASGRAVACRTLQPPPLLTYAMPSTPRQAQPMLPGPRLVASSPPRRREGWCSSSNGSAVFIFTRTSRPVTPEPVRWLSIRQCCPPALALLPRRLCPCPCPCPMLSACPRRHPHYIFTSPPNSLLLRELSDSSTFLDHSHLSGAHLLPRLQDSLPTLPTGITTATLAT